MDKLQSRETQFINACYKRGLTYIDAYDLYYEFIFNIKVSPSIKVVVLSDCLILAESLKKKGYTTAFKDKMGRFIYDEICANFPEAGVEDFKPSDKI